MNTDLGSYPNRPHLSYNPDSDCDDYELQNRIDNLRDDISHAEMLALPSVAKGLRNTCVDALNYIFILEKNLEGISAAVRLERHKAAAMIKQQQDGHAALVAPPARTGERFKARPLGGSALSAKSFTRLK